MSYVKFLNVKDHFLRKAAKKDSMNDLKHEIEAKLQNLDTEGLAYGRPDMIQLIISIEKYKLRFLQGDMSAKQLYDKVASKLDRFKRQYPGFDFLNDPAMNVYF
jgi:hypothetical protein